MKTAAFFYSMAGIFSAALTLYVVSTFFTHATSEDILWALVCGVFFLKYVNPFIVIPLFIAAVLTFLLGIWSDE